MSSRGPAKGDLIRVEWRDICEDPCGDPMTAKLARRVSFGLFYDRRVDDGVRVLVTTNTQDEETDYQSGYCIYPLSCITRIRVIRKGAAEFPR